MNKHQYCCLLCKHWRAPAGGRKNATCGAEGMHDNPCSGKSYDGTDVDCTGCGVCPRFDRGDDQTVAQLRKQARAAIRAATGEA